MARTAEPMTQGIIWKRLTLFALPIFFGNLFQQLYNVVDSLIVGNFLGSNALAAVSSSGNLTFMLIGFLIGISSGAGVVMSKYFGAGDRKTMQTAIHTTVAFGLAASLVIMAAGVCFSPRLLIWMNTPESVMGESVTYLRIYFAGAFGFVMYNVFVGILQAVGDSRHPLYYLMISTLVNIMLDIILIRRFHMGVAGAAAATVISQFLSAGLCLQQLLRTKESYKLSLSKIGVHADMLREIIRIGLPSGIQNSIISFANVVVQSQINTFGAMAMAGCGAFSKIEGFGFLPITSFMLALTTFVGQNLGGKEYERTKRGVRFGVVTAVILAETIGILVFILAPQLIAAFDSTPEVVRLGTEKARTSCLFFFLLAYSHSIAAVLRGAGKTMVSMIVMMSFWCVVRVAFLVITVPLTHSIQMIYWVYPLTWALSSAAFFFYYRRADWIHGLD